MGKQIHYEIYARFGGGDYALLEAMTDRAKALKLAEETLKEGHAAAVKVMKETFDDATGEFATLKIFEDGKIVKTVKKPSKLDDEDAAPPLPCFKPDDLYSVHARATMARMLSDALARMKLTVTEFIHRADALEKFEATGTLYQHAVQKIAVAQAKSSDKNVAQLMKTLMELTTRAIHQVYRDEREGVFPKASAAGFPALAGKLAGQPRAAYALNGAIAKHLAGAQSWSDKLAAVLELARTLPEDEQAAKLLLSCIDVIVGEIVAGGAALSELLGEQPNLGAALLAMLNLILGQGVPETGNTGLIALAAEFKAGRFASARRAIAQRVMGELRSPKRLVPASLEEEVKLMRQLAGRMVMVGPAIIPQEDIITIFAVRSQRLVTPEAVESYATAARDPLERVERVLQLEENVIGSENKRRIAGYLLPMLTAHNMEMFIVEAKSPPLPRLQRLVDLQSRLRRSGMQDIEKRNLSEAVDRLAMKIVKKTGFIEAMAPRDLPPPARMVALLQMFGEKAVTEGSFANAVRAELSPHLKNRAAVTSFLAQSGEDQNKALDEFHVLLDAAGLDSNGQPKASAA